MTAGVCACGCGQPVTRAGLEPRFANLDGSCQARWLAVLDHAEPLAPLVADEPVTDEERAAVRADLAERWRPAVEVPPRTQSMWKAAVGLARRVW